jgi:hypothetical protein
MAGFLACDMKLQGVMKFVRVMGKEGFRRRQRQIEWKGQSDSLVI